MKVTGVNPRANEKKEREVISQHYLNFPQFLLAKTYSSISTLVKSLFS